MIIAYHTLLSRSAGNNIIEFIKLDGDFRSFNKVSGDKNDAVGLAGKQVDGDDHVFEESTVLAATRTVHSQ